MRIENETMRRVQQQASVAAVATLVVTSSMYSVSLCGDGLPTFSVRQQEWGGKENLDGPSIPTARDETGDRSELVIL